MDQAKLARMQQSVRIGMFCSTLEWRWVLFPGLRLKVLNRRGVGIIDLDLLFDVTATPLV